MKRIVQRFALAFLLLLPMLANAQVTTTATAKYGARGTVEVKGHNATVYDTVVTVVNTGYFIDNGASWLNGTSVIDPGTTAGTLPVENPTANTYWLILDKNLPWNIIVKHLPTYPEVTFTATHGSVQDGKETPYGAITSPQAYAYGTHVYLHAIPATSYTFGAWLKSAAVDADTLSDNADIDFYIFDDTTFYPSFDAAQYKITITLAPQNSAPLTAAFSSIELYDEVHDETIVNYTTDLNVAKEITLPYDRNVQIWPTITGNYEAVMDWSVNGTPEATANHYTLPNRTADMAVTITAVPKNYTVTINNDDDYFGTVSTGGSWAYGSIHTITATVNDPSFKFVEWKENGTTISTDASFDYLVTGNKTVTAYWDYATFPVTLTADPLDKGTFKIDAVAYNPATEYSFGTNHTVVAAPADGYHFVQWSDNGSTSPTRDITIATTNSYIAEFGTESYAVSFADNGYAGKLTLEGDGTYDFGIPVTITATELNNAQYVFDGWQINGGSTITTNPYTFTIESATTVTALYSAVEYNVTIADGNGTIDPANGQVAYGSDFTLTAADLLPGKTFNHWELGGSSVSTNATETFTLNTVGNREYTAVYDNNSFTVSATVVPAGSGTIEGTGSKEFGSNVTLTALNAEHYHFLKWDDNSTANALSFTMPASNVEHTATFGIDSFTVSVTTNAVAMGSATINGAASASLPYGSSIETLVNTVPATDYQFVEWQVAGTAVDLSMWTVPASNVTLTAVFEHAPVTITVTTDPVALDDPLLANPTFTPATPEFGQDIALSYTAVEGYTFAGWKKGSIDVADPDHVTVDGDATYTAYFIKNTYNISVAQTPNDGSMGTVTIGGGTSKLMEHGDMVGALIDTQSVAGYELIGWTDGNGAEITDINAYPATKAETLTAVFNYATLDVTATAVDSAEVVDFVSLYSPVFTITGFKILGGIIQTTAPDNIAGWHFKGWKNEPYAAKANVNPRKDTLTSFDPVKYIAIYARNVYKVTLNADENKTTSKSGNGVYRFEDEVTLALAAKPGYTCTGWKDQNNNDYAVDAVFNITSDLVLTAQFTTNKYDVTAAAVANGSVAPTSIDDVEFGTSYSLEATPNFGYKLEKWVNDVDETQYTTKTINPTMGASDIAWTASFAKYDFDVTVTIPKDVDNEVMGTAPLDGNKKLGETFTIEPSANQGYKFVKIHGEESGTDYTTSSPEYSAGVFSFSVNAAGDDTTFTVYFERDEFTVTATVNNPAMGSVTPETKTDAFKTKFNLVATPNTGYDFLYWNDDADPTYPTIPATREVSIPANNTTVYTAVFGPQQHSITVVAGDHGSVEIDGVTGSTVTDDFGKAYTIKANAAEGYHFSKWNDNNTDNPRDVTILAEDKTYTATFAATEYQLTLTSSNVYHGGVRFLQTDPSAANVNKMVEYGSTVRIEAVPEYGYVLESWSDGDTHKVREQYAYNIAHNVELTATFVKRPYNVTVTLNNAALGTIEINGNAAQSGVAVPVEYTTRPHIVITPIANYHINNTANPAAPFDINHSLELDTTVLSDISLEYTIRPDTFNVVFNVNDDNFGIITGAASKPYAYGTVLNGVTAVPAENYHFDSWSDSDPNAAHSPITVTSDITLTANFSIDNHTLDVAVASEDNNKGTVTASVTSAAHGTSVTVTATPKTGYAFDRWTDDNNNNADVAGAGATYTFDLNANTALIAHFVNETHTLTVSTFTPERGWISIVDGNAVETKDETGATVSVSGLPTHTDITVTATANTGYHFDSWSDDPSITTAQRVISDLNQDSSFTANFAYDTYTVTWNPNVAARGDIEALGTVAYHFGAVDTLKANPAAGYIFQKWEDGSTVNPRYYTVNGDADLTAIFIYDTVHADTTWCDVVEWNGHTYTVSEVAAPVTLTDEEGYDSIVVMTVNINYSTTEDIYAEECESYTWTTGDGQTYTSTQDVPYVMTNGNVAGCDSTVTLHLTINQPAAGTDVQEHCVSYEWMDNVTYTESTNTPTFVLTGQAQNGCDSIVTLNLTINTPSAGTDVQENCVSYTWIDGITYTESTNTPTFVLTGADHNGCDSIVTLNLTINQPSAGTDVQEHCDSYTWIDAVTYTESTTTPTYVLTAADHNGCDSIVTLNLTINQTAGERIEATQCDTYTWALNNNVYTGSGEYTYGHLNANGCFVVDTLALTINHNSSTRFADQDVCDVYNQTWTDNTTEAITVSDEYLHDYISAEGCPSTDTITVVIRKSAAGTDVHHDICDSYTWPLNGETYTESNNTASVTLTAANGCDSIVTLDLTINKHQDTEEDITACDSYDWTVNGETYTESGTYTEEIFDDNNCVATATLNLTISESNTGIDEQHACNTFTWIDNVTYTESNNTATKTLTNMAGCDSVVTLNLTVTYNQDVEIYDSGCESYEWNGLTFTTSRDVVYTTTDQFGCDSVTTLHLTINQPTAGEFTDSAYGLYIWNGETYQTDGDYQQTLTDGNGCDSVVTLHLTILLPENPYLYDTACVSYTWEANGMTYTESGAYNDTIRSLVNGEDSIITTLYLLINEPVNPEPVDIAACGAYTWHGTVYDVAGTYTFDTIDAHNCAITETINLTINTAVDPDAVEVIACDSYDWHGERTASGTYTFDTVDANGCAITETLNLTINESQNVTLPEVVACESYEWNGHTYTASGDLSYTTTDVNGCDSTTTLSLYVTYGTHNTVSAEACGSYTWNDSTYTATGVYTYSYLNVDQCESVDTLNLTINEAQTVALPAVTACDSYEWNGVTYTASEELSVTVPGVNGCDSTTTLALTINQHQDSQVSATACDTYTWTVDNNTYTVSGNYTAAITDENGCAATATLALTINQHQDTVENITACDTYTWTANNQTYTTGGTYTAAITDANGCAATGTLNLTVNQHQDSQVSASACDTYTWNGSTYTTSGTYTTPITDANGCAATATLTLTVNQSVTNAIALSDTGSVTYNNVTYTADTVVTVTYTAANGCDSTVTATITVIPEVVAPDSVFVYVGVNYPAHGTVNPSTYANYAIGETVTATATPDSGYMFAYWLVGYINAAGTLYDTLYTNPFSYVLTADDTNYSIIAFAAEFESISGAEDSMTVILATADAAMGTTNPVPGTYRIAEGDSIIFSAVANTGYQFLYWIRETQYTTSSDIYVDTIFGETRQIDGLAWLMETTATYTAYFQVDTNYVPDTIYHFVTLMTANATMGTVSASDSVMDGAEFTATAYPNDGYHFVAWTNGGVLMSNDNPYTFTVNADITLTATFEADPVDTVYYNVTVNYDATMGTVTGAGTYIEGDIVTLQATPNTGYHFVGWYDANDQLLTTVSSYTFTVSANVTFNAQFAADPVYYTVNATANDPAMGSVEGAGQYVAGVTVSLTAQANEGYHFVSWSNGETTPTISFTVTCDTTFVATFAPNDTPQAIDETDMSNVTIYSADSRIIIRGAEGMDVNVYDINGRTINTQMNAGETVEFRMATTGVYLVKVGNAPAKRVLVVR